jgi:acyl-CoA synthetase (AMP-forming)/AMP-acid ligase II
VNYSTAGSASALHQVFNVSRVLLDDQLEAGREDALAIEYESRQVTYSQLARLVNRAGNALRQAGLGREQRVALLAPDSLNYVAAYLGAMRIGAVPVPLSTSFTRETLLYCLADSRASHVLVSADLLEPVLGIAETLPAAPRVYSLEPCCATSR